MEESKKSNFIKKEQEKFYDVLIDSIKDFIYWIDKEGKFIFVSKSAKEITGYSSNEFLENQNLFKKIIHPDDVKNVESKMSKEYLNKDDCSIQFRIITKKGGIKYISHICTPVYSNKNEIIGRIATNRDITNIEQIKEKVKKKEELFEKILNSTPDPINIIDKNFNIVYANKNLLSLVGKELYEIKGKHCYKIYQKRDKRCEICAPKFVFDKKKSKTIEKELPLPSGEIKYFETRAFPVLDEKGEVINAIEVTRDITKRKKIEKNLEKSNKMFYGIFLNTKNGMIIANKENIIQDINPAMEKITGYSKKDIVGKTIFEFNYLLVPKEKKINKSFKEYLAEKINKYKNKNIIKTLKDNQIKIQRKDNQIRILQPTYINLEVNKENFIIVIARDITDEEILKAQLLQSQKIEAVGILTGGIAHDFNNILTVINGYSDIALKRLNKTDPNYKIFKAINSAGLKGEKLIKQLLAFSRKQVYSPKVLNINNLINNLKKILIRYIPEDIKLEFKLSEDILNIKADYNQIEQILINLIVNARDAINENKKSNKKTITIETGNAYFSKSKIKKYPDFKKGKFVFLTVNDTGVGIDDKIKDKIFDPFFSTKGNKGTGLGLSTVYGIVKQNNGFIYVYSEKGKGTTIKIYWPATKLKEEEEIYIKEEELNSLKGDEKILLVEDNKEILDFASEGLESLGYNIITALNGKEALEIINKKKIKPDILITDLIMPNIDGEELSNRIKRIYPNIKIIFTSGYTENHIVNKGILKQNINFISKPYTINELAKKIKELKN